MQLKSLRALVAVAKHASFGVAAHELNTVQSNITAHIKKLEHELGVSLFSRHGIITLTPAGHALLPYATRMLELHEQACALFKQPSLEGGMLRIGAMETAAAYRLPPILAQFHQRFASVQLLLKTGSTRELTQALLAGELDGVFVAGAIPSHEVTQREVFAEELVLVSGQPLTHLPSAEQWLRARFLAFRQGCSYRQRIELFMAEQGVPATQIIELGSLDALLGCIAAGMGYGLLPKAMVTEQTRFKVYTLTLPRHLALAPTYWATLTPEGSSPALQAFDALLSESCCHV